MSLNDTWSKRIKPHVEQQPYKNGGGLSRKDWLKLGAAWLVLFVAGWAWHDWFGKPLPSSEVMEFARHIGAALGLTGLVGAGMAHARRRRP